MRFTHYINGWENFTNVVQDTPGIVVTTGGGLYTANLANCLCLILTDETNSYGMLHVSPGHENTKLWVESLRNQVKATAAIVAGANGDNKDSLRKNELASLLNGLTVVDETRTGWVPDGLRPVRGSNTGLVGYVAVNANNGEYALSTVAFAASSAPVAPRTRARRNSGDGLCIVM